MTLKPFISMSAIKIANFLVLKVLQQTNVIYRTQFEHGIRLPANLGK